MFEKLLNRLRGGRPKRTPQEIARSYNKSIFYHKQENFSIVQDENKNSASMSENVINIKNHSYLQEIFDKLNNLSGFEEFTNNPQFNWVKVRIDRVRGELEKMQPPENFEDEELNFNLAKKIKSVATAMLEIISNCDSATNIDTVGKQNLKNLVENYLTALGIEQKNFFAGDSFEAWAELNMQNSYLIESTYDYNLHNKIKNVEIQPRIIYYINEFGEVDKFIFGGLCTAYKFKEG